MNIELMVKFGFANDGSYAYENSTSKIEILSDGHFKWTDPNLPEEIRESNFIKLEPGLRIN